jgi:hypothetical protein
MARPEPWSPRRGIGRTLPLGDAMLRKIARLFVIKTRFEAYVIIYALALGSTARGSAYLEQLPGWPGYLLFLATTGAVFLAGAKILDCIRLEKELAALRAERSREAE